jgi:CHAT domain-containing protein
VASSATLWARAERAGAAGDGRVVLVAGPDLPGAPLEVAELAGRHTGAVVLTGEGATAAALAAALPSASLLHVAAHGRFRADNPLFSSLVLADGPLTANDLERLRPLPPHVVLASCEVGQAEVRAGDELLGLASVLFPAGVRTLVASVALAPDAATHLLMGAYHRAVSQGRRPAAALRDARRVARATGPDGVAAAAAFCCFGWG